jgi:hypothetical protein
MEVAIIIGAVIALWLIRSMFKKKKPKTKKKRSFWRAFFDNGWRPPGDKWNG